VAGARAMAPSLVVTVCWSGATVRSIRRDSGTERQWYRLIGIGGTIRVELGQVVPLVDESAGDSDATLPD
jgi:hypothetical protein